MIHRFGHTVPPPSDSGGGGANVPLVVVGVAAVVAGLVLARRGAPRRWIPWAVVVAGLAAGIFGFVAGGDDGGNGRPDATVAILAPDQGATVEVGEPVTVRVRLEGGSLATSPDDREGGHLHLYVDGQLQQMPYGEETEVTIDEAGPHLVTVEYVDHDHLSYDPPIVGTVALRAR